MYLFFNNKEGKLGDFWGFSGGNFEAGNTEAGGRRPMILKFEKSIPIKRQKPVIRCAL